MQLSSTGTSATTLSAMSSVSLSWTGYLQFLGEFTNPCLDCRVLWVFDMGLGFIDQVVHDLVSNSSKLLGVCVCNCLSGGLRCAA
jgi:hypothetical protein